MNAQTMSATSKNGSEDWINIYSSIVEFLNHEVHIWKVVRGEDDQIKTWTLIDANPEALKSWGRNLSEIVGKTTDEIFPEAEASKTFMPIVKKIISEQKPHEWQTFFSGTNQVLGMISIPAGDYFISVGTDMSSEIKSKEFITHAHRLESLGALAGGVAHDINNILGIVLVSADRLAELTSDAQQLKIIETIVEACSAGSDLTKLVLSFTKGDEIAQEEIDINDKLLSITNLIKSTIGDHIEIEFKENRSLPKIMGNRIHVKQILFNVINNAIQSMRQEGGTLSLSLERVNVSQEEIPVQMEKASPGAFLKIAICDTGCGIEECNWSKIFDPFSSFDQRKGGSGLGLAIVRTLIQAHLGFITFDSELGKGSNFYIYFPV